MKDYPKIWFLRHGQTEWNKAYRLQGQLDSPLTEQGIVDAERQATLIAPVLAQQPDVYVSPLGRAVQTAKIVLGETPYRMDARLMEIHAGEWQGRLRAEILAGMNGPEIKTFSALDIYEAATGGEGLAAFQARIRSFLQDVTGPSVIVAHGLFGQVLRAEVCGLDMGAAGHLSNRQGCIYVLENGQESIMEPSE